MNPRFYIAVRPRTNGLHLVHKEDCPFITNDDSTIYLGRFSSENEAEMAGSIHFGKAKNCAFCTKAAKRIFNDKMENSGLGNNVTETIFLCCVN